MSDLPSFVRDHPPWNHLLRLLDEGRPPQAVALSAPTIYHELLATAYAERLLSLARGEGPSSDLEHPDHLRCGSEGEPPGVDDCRRLWRDLSLYPVGASWRLGVLFSADRLSPGAANSLLKMTEEPPPRARLLFLLDEGSLIPTLQSRCWNLNITSAAEVTSLLPPKGTEEWIQWFSSPKGSEERLLHLRGWATGSLDEGEADLACSLESVRLVAERARLSEPMLQDLTYLVVKEDLSLEQIFSDIW